MFCDMLGGTSIVNCKIGQKQYHLDSNSMTVTVDLFKMKLLMPDEVWYFYFLVQFVGCKVLHYLGKI